MGASSRLGIENGSGGEIPPDPLPFGNRTGARVALLRSPILQPAIASSPQACFPVKSSSLHLLVASTR